MGELICECMDDMCGSVSQTLVQCWCKRGTLPRLLNGEELVSANMALTLDDIGWGTADQWMRTQGSNKLAKPRRNRAAVDGRVPVRTDGTLSLARRIGHGAD